MSLSADLKHGKQQPSMSDAVAWACVLSLGLIWGSTFLTIRLALRGGFQPFQLVAARVTLAAVALLLLLWSSGKQLPRSRKSWTTALLVSVFNTVYPYSIITWAQQYISSGFGEFWSTAPCAGSSALLLSPCVLSHACVHYTVFFMNSRTQYDDYSHHGSRGTSKVDCGPSHYHVISYM